MLLKLKLNIVIFLKGAFIGIANIIPGLSGGTVALILGIYEKLIFSISNIFLEKRINKLALFFLIKIFFSAAVAIYVLSNVVSYILTNHFVLFMYFLIGVVLGSIPTVIKRYNTKINFIRIIFLFLGLAAIIFLTFVFEKYSFNREVIYGLSKQQYIILVLTGLFSGAAMITPGISGSLIMVIFGQYELVIHLLRNIKIIPIIFLVFGIVLGIFIFAKLISFLLKRFTSVTIYFIIGLVVGSSYKMYPGLPIESRMLIFSLVIFIFGILCSLVLHCLSFKKKITL